MQERGLSIITALTALLISLLTIPIVASPGVQPEWLPTPREETLVMHDSYPFTIFDSFNPFIPQGHDYQSGHYQLCVEFLWYINYATGEVIPWLITGWEYEDNYTTFILHVRRGVTWNDGKPFTAHDIVFTVKMLKKYPELFWHAYMDEWVEDAYAPDNYTAIIKLKKPNPRFHFAFRGWECPIVPKHIWENVDPRTFKNYPPVWTGPYKLKAVYPELRMFVWERRDDYWACKVLGKCPEPKYAVMRTAPPPDVLFPQYVRGETDFGRDLPIEMLPKAKEINANVTWVPFLDPCPRGVWINCAKYPLNLSEVRWAIAYLIDREKLAQLWPSLETPPTVPATFPWADWPGLRKFVFPDVFAKYKLEYNPQKAKEIFDKLGFVDRNGDGWRELPNGTKISWTIITPVSPAQPSPFEYIVAEELAKELRKIGIDATAKYVPGPEIGDLIAFGKFDIVSAWLCTGMPWNNDVYYLVEGFHSKYAKMYPIGERMLAGSPVRLQDPELDKVIDELAVIGPDHPKYMELAERAVELFMRDLPAIPVVQTVYTMAWLKTYWTNWPEKGNFHSWPPTWWPEFLFVVLNLKSTKPKPTPPPEAPLLQRLNTTVIEVSQRVAKLTDSITALQAEISNLRGSVNVIIALTSIAVLISIIGIALPFIKKK